MSMEWNENIALKAWPDQRGIWNPVSWKDHLYDFNVLFDGSIITSLNSSQVFTYRTAYPEEQALGMILNVKGWASPEVDGASPDSWLRTPRNPDGMHISRWAECKCPLLIVEHCLPGILVEQRQFAHVSGGRLLAKGNEPMYLQVRFKITDVIDLINEQKRICFTFSPQADNLMPSMHAFNNLPLKYEKYPYPLFLRGESDTFEQRYENIKKNGKENCYLRLGVARYGRRNLLGIPRQEGIMAEYLAQKLYTESSWAAVNSGHLMISMKAKVGSHFDVVIPIVPAPDNDIKREMAVGYETALKETERFWKKELSTPTSLTVPEKLVQGHIDVLPRLVAMISGRDVETGDYGIETATIRYEAIWATPAAFSLIALDFLGYGKEVEKYLEIFRKYQGQEKPPSNYLDRHPGYLGVPPHFESVDWLSDHGAILYSAAWHGLLSLDKNFLKQWVPSIVKACEWIKDARRFKKHNGYKGIMPPAVATDDIYVTQNIWSDTWNHKGLRTAARLLKRVGHKRADEFLKEADDYRDTFCKIYRQAVDKAGAWTAPGGGSVPFTPYVISNRRGGEKTDICMLDTGACSLVFGELFTADDPIMKATLRWLREGPQHKHFRRFSEMRQAPVLVNEISSAEPGYSWNIFHTLQRGDREKFTMGFYSLLAGGASQTSYISCETREGVFGHCCTGGFALLVLRHCMIEEKEDDLHLMRMAPLALFGQGGFEWKNVPTGFGEMSLAGKYDHETGRLEIKCAKPKRQFMNKVIVHIPPFEKLKMVILNNKETKANKSITVI